MGANAIYPFTREPAVIEKSIRLVSDRVTVQHHFPLPSKKRSYLTTMCKYVNSTTHVTVFNLHYPSVRALQRGLTVNQIRTP